VFFGKRKGRRERKSNFLIFGSPLPKGGKTEEEIKAFPERGRREEEGGERILIIALR